ncbi:MAG TPA: M20/M25/M40 family metallo-hydrolase [Bacteroidales bacterium]|nr:M20/M25/M40 family metallo-hydrolase [Bacteroidales bacterium]HPF03444.1 M20/M25/M40 family metallo-hydrolase [Bacteroidales bacterium]HPJ60096.1 M20/M25/M40 family metallo-hydrolase [Bacteroidales bacterium]HPR12996.1 M20/M25/M40 family metallo-hydrolase [Bacteroidales bacterium]HRW85347.1 M20/M25/M40 family metallo-hydrolase [Bacteroidales bacterium]
MKKLVFHLILLLILFPARAQTIITRDPDITRMVTEISAENIEKYVRTLAGFHTRHNLSTQTDPVRGIGAAWNWIKSEMEKNIPASGGRLSVKFEEYSVGRQGQRISRPVVLKNVVATLKGTDSSDDRKIIISAHFDSRVQLDNDSTSYAPGADDDGSGIAAILELLRIMSPEKFPATIVFMALSGEEHGLYGARHMAELAKKENWNIVAMLNNDMIGNSSSNETLLNDNMRVRVFSEGVPAYETERMAALRKYTSGENDGKARQLARYIKEIGERYVDQLTVTLVFRNDRFGRGGDHSPFCEQGFTAVRICEFNENYNRTHKIPALSDGVQEGDLPEYVDYEYVRKNAGINLATIANLALAPDCPVNCGIVAGGLTNKTTLRWEAPAAGQKPAGYFILMRETWQPLWEKKIFVTGTEVTLPYSKDNYFFAVQSVDASGHESLAVFPGQARRQATQR